MDNKNKDFEFTPSEASEILEAENKQSVVVTDADFKLVNREDYALDQKFETKPTTFLKDSLKRFSKNKSSVVASWILGALVLLAIIVPLTDLDNSKTSVHPHEVYLEPKLFNAGTGFWDGTKKYSNIAYDSVNNCPDPADFETNAISNLKVDDGVSYTNSYSVFGKGGYVQLSEYSDSSLDSVYLESYPMSVNLDTDFENSIAFSTKGIEVDEISNYQSAPFRVEFVYSKWNDVTSKYEEDIIVVRENSSEYGDFTINLSSALTAGQYKDAKIRIVMDCSNKDANSCLLIKSIVFTTNATDETYASDFTAPTFEDATHMIGRIQNSADKAIYYHDYWNSTGYKYLYQSEIKACSFTYDTYKAAFGIKTESIDQTTLNIYKKNGWCNYNSKVGISSFEKLSNRCPIEEVLEQTISSGSTPTVSLTCKVTYYKYLGYTSMPRYIMGTNKSGQVMFTYVFKGLLTSLMLGVITSAICFIFGLCWGAISGYFGGNVDLAMERFTDILGGLPWIVVMTLCIIHLGSSFWTFALALCLTGWIGTSSLTRTQFYRFKGREYVLASRTLGASDMRLIFKHILPNAMGTIVTSAVLMIPSVIFSEATISYLGLGLKGLSSLGVILSDNQAELLQHAYLLIFPSVIIALLEICFNLFGNGLRDAINPTLKGEDEQ